MRLRVVGVFQSQFNGSSVTTTTCMFSGRLGPSPGSTVDGPRLAKGGADFGKICRF